MISNIENKIDRIDLYIDRAGYSSYDPYDGLFCSMGNWLLHKNQLLARVWQQAIRLFPVNLRPLFGIKKIAHTKAISDFSSAYSLLYKSTQKEDYKHKAEECLQLLGTINSPTKNGIGWGLRFPFATRFVKAEASQANIFQTINAIHSFLDGYEALGHQQYLDTAQQGFLFLKNDLGFKETDKTISWNYWEDLDVEIFNVSGLMIGLCARMWTATGHEQYKNFSKKLFQYIKQGQNEDGSWFYSTDPKGKFIDGFHTGYILEGILRGVEHHVIEKEDCLQRGIDFYLSNFFTGDHTPKYFNHSTYPLDGQNFAQAIQTLNFIFNANFVTENQVIACFERVDHLLWNEKGYYNYKKTRWLTYKTPMHRWVTGPFFLALTYLKTQRPQS